MSSISRLLAAVGFLLVGPLVLSAPARHPNRAARRAAHGGHSGRGRFKVGTLEHFEEFCRRFLTLEDGIVFAVEPFQRLILRGYFAGVMELLVLLPKKNGKTTLLAALALYHLVYTPNAQCYIAASVKEQARVMYDQACGFLERIDPTTGKKRPGAAALSKRLLLRRGTKEIRNRRDTGFIRVVSGDKDTVDGVIVTLALVDELHRHKDGGQLYGVLADGLGPRNGQIVTISTAGESMKSALGRMRAKALKLPGLQRDGRYTFVRSPNDQFEMHEWALRPGDDREDLELVKQVNPLSSVTLEKLRVRKKSPAMTPSRWARFGCGVWMQDGDAALSALDVARCVKAARPIPRGAAIYIGLDLGWRWDTTAIVPMQVLEPVLVPNLEDAPAEADRARFPVRYGAPRILIPPRDGTSLARQTIIDAILDFSRVDGFEILGVVFDRNAEGESIAGELELTHGLRVIEHSQDPSPMAAASMGLAEAIGEGLAELPDHDEFLAHLVAAKAQTTSGEKWRFVAPTKSRGARRKGRRDQDDVEYIDAAIAAAIVRRNALADEGEPDPSLYRMEFA